MSKITLEVDKTLAARILKEYESELVEKHNERTQLGHKIVDLESKVKSLKEQLQVAGEENGRTPAGENLSKIKGYLTAISGNKGAKMSDIVNALGIGTSSVNFTLTNKKNSDVFVKDGKVWKLKI